MATTKDLGFIQAIISGTIAPTNTMQLWYDTNIGQNRLKYYNTILSTWVGVYPRYVITIPSSGSASGVYGDFTYDSGFKYECVATNTWIKIARTAF